MYFLHIQNHPDEQEQKILPDDFLRIDGCILKDYILPLF